MENVIIANLYSNIFSCSYKIIKSVEDIDSYIDIIVYSLSDYFGDNFNFYVKETELVVISPKNYWITDIAPAFAKMQKELDQYIQAPVQLSTGEIPNPTYWKVQVLYGAIVKKAKISYL